MIDVSIFDKRMTAFDSIEHKRFLRPRLIDRYKVKRAATRGQIRLFVMFASELALRQIVIDRAGDDN